MAARSGNPRGNAPRNPRAASPRHSHHIRHVELAGTTRTSHASGTSRSQHQSASEQTSSTRRKSAKQASHTRNPRVAAHSASLQHRSSVHKRGKHDSANLDSYQQTPSAKPSVRTSGHNADYNRLKRTSEASRSSVDTARNLDSQALDSSRTKRKKKRVVMASLAAVVALCLVGAGAAFAYVYSINKNLQNKVDGALLSALSPVDTPTDPFYVLLLGTDGSKERMAQDKMDEGGYRSDSMMLARIDPQNKKAAIISIPRDTQVELPGHGKQKINSALAFGGPSLAVSTVSKMAGVPIAHYAEVNFDGFAAMVDALGGVEVDVPIPINDDEAGGSLAAGTQTLNGEGALILCRTRHTYDKYGAGDVYRAANQRLVLSAIAQKMLSVDPFALADSVKRLSEYVTTDLDVSSIVGIAQGMRGLSASEDMYTAVAPTKSEYKGGGWYEILDTTTWKNMIARMEEGLPPVGTDQVDLSTGTVLSSAGGKSEGFTYKVNTATTIRLRNGCGEQGACDEALQKLKDVGYVNISTGNADSFNYDDTLVIYKKKSQENEAKAIAKLLGGIAKKDDGKFLFESNYLIVIGKN